MYVLHFNTFRVNGVPSRLVCCAVRVWRRLNNAHYEATAKLLKTCKRPNTQEGYAMELRKWHVRANPSFCMLCFC